MIKGSVQWTSTDPTVAENLFIFNCKLFLPSHSKQYIAGLCCQVGTTGIHICFYLWDMQR